jgi:uncharacterized protein (TIGR02246 family)
VNPHSSQRNITASLLFLGVAFATGNAAAQTASDLEAVKAANQAFSSALSARDIAAMRKVWAADADIQEIGPSAKAVSIGWEAIKKGFEGYFANVQEITITVDQPRIKVNGPVAWVSTTNHSQTKDKAGASRSSNNFSTAIFEKKSGDWLMVYHHNSRIPD